jgi:hypothetical protein
MAVSFGSFATTLRLNVSRDEKIGTVFFWGVGGGHVE